VNAARAEVLILENRRVTIRDLFVSLEVIATLSLKKRGAVEVTNAVMRCLTEEHKQLKERSDLPEFILT
jgi:hypothetical protein